ncbi:sulfite exporter TauE/SafE family protein [Robiginitalea marina]|uniref:sulfite exporter TauE/SafE family protein n=1 Tax=Robiginitalea marina TaxID=2954105 RepID=UPI0021128CAE|nr:sulfite exporter TauE/SafE family protein [Robiginitalea marina]
MEILGTAMVLGLLGSLHCIGMCGPIAFMLPLKRNDPYRQWGQLGIYHMGRLLAYGMIGLVFGLIGKGLYLFGFQQKLSIVLGVVMILTVLIPGKVFRGWKPAQPVYRLLGRLQGALGAQLKTGKGDAFLSIGFLNGLLPCGLVYMALIGALAMASAPMGALYMMVFGAGTIPLMSGAALLGKMFKGAWVPRVRQWIPAFVVVIGLLFILRGMGLGIPYVSPKAPEAGQVNTSMECHP